MDKWIKNNPYQNINLFKFHYWYYHQLLSKNNSTIETRELNMGAKWQMNCFFRKKKLSLY